MEATSSVTAQASQQQFLQLLVAQVQYQDPLEPIKQEDFIQQLAQFSTLEGIEKLNVQFGDMLALQQLTDGGQLLGKTVRFDDGGTAFTGKVDEAAAVDGQLMLSIGGKQIPISNVLAVLDGSQP